MLLVLLNNIFMYDWILIYKTQVAKVRLETIAPFNVLAIRHPAAVDGVLPHPPLARESGECYTCVVYVSSQHETSRCHAGVNSGATLFNIPRQELFGSCAVHANMDAQANTGP